MWKLVVIETHGVVEFTGTQITAIAKMGTAREQIVYVAAYLYNENGRLIDQHTKTTGVFEALTAI